MILCLFLWNFSCFRISGEREGFKMEWEVLASSLGIALVLLLPLALKWQIKPRYALSGAIAIGAATGVLWSWDWLRGITGNNIFLLMVSEFTTIIFFTLIAV